MKFVILSANSKMYDYYKSLQENGKMLRMFHANFKINDEDVILLYSIQEREIKFVLKSNLLLRDSKNKEIWSEMEKLDSKEFEYYGDFDVLKNKDKKCLFEFRLIGEFSQGKTFYDLGLPMLRAPEVLKYVREVDPEFEEILGLVNREVNLTSFIAEKKAEKEKIKATKKAARKTKSVKAEENKEEDNSNNIEFKMNEEDNDIIYIVNNFKKRDTYNIKKLKEAFYSENEDKCERCGYSFKENMGENYIELHHKESFDKWDRDVQYSSFKEAKKDFKFLCANCHVIADFENKN